MKNSKMKPVHLTCAAASGISRLAVLTCLALVIVAALAVSCGGKKKLLPTEEGLYGVWLSNDRRTLTFYEDMTGISDYRELESLELSRFAWHLEGDKLKVYYETRFTVTFDLLAMTLFDDTNDRRTDFLCRETSKIGSIVAVWQAIDPASQDPEYTEEDETEIVLWTFNADGTGVRNYQYSAAEEFTYVFDSQTSELRVYEDIPDTYTLVGFTLQTFRMIPETLLEFTKTEGLDGSIRGVWVSGSDVMRLNKDGSGDLNDTRFFTWKEDKGTLTLIIGKKETVYICEHKKDKMSLRPVYILTRQTKTQADTEKQN